MDCELHSDSLSGHGSARRGWVEVIILTVDKEATDRSRLGNMNK